MTKTFATLDKLKLKRMTHRKRYIKYNDRWIKPQGYYDIKTKL